MSEKLDQFKIAYESTFPYHNEDFLTLSWYADRLIRSATTLKPKRCLSLGIGRCVVLQKLAKWLADDAERYTVIEGSGDIIDACKTSYQLPENVEIIQSQFESFEPNAQYDIIEMGFVLEHVDDPALILSHYRRFLAPNGVLFVAVPNANSFHRRLGNVAGFLDDIYKLSEADHQLGHQRYFDSRSIVALVEENGYRILKQEGLFFKPFTTTQLRSLELGEKVWQGLLELGIDYPELCNAVLIEASAST